MVGAAVAAGGVILPAVPLAALLGLASSTPAAAAVQCSAGINGIDANRFATPQEAITVAEHTQLVVDGSNPGVPVGQPLHYLIQLQFYYPWGEKTHWTVALGNTTSKNFVRRIDVDKYATKSSGLYLAHVIAYGPTGSSPCETDAFIDVKSSRPSDVEVAAGVLGVAGLAGTLGAGLLAGTEGRALSDADLLAGQAAADAEDVMLDMWAVGKTCSVLAPVAVALTIRAMMSQAVHHAVSHFTRSVS